MFEVTQEDYDMICSENKMFAEFLSNLGYSQEDISSIANTGRPLTSESYIKIPKDIDEILYRVEDIFEDDSADVIRNYIKELTDRVTTLGIDFETAVMELNKLKENKK